MRDVRNLRGATFVLVVQATEVRNRHEVAVVRRRHSPRDRRIFVEGQMRSSLQVILDVGVEDVPQPALVRDDDMIDILDEWTRSTARHRRSATVSERL